MLNNEISYKAGGTIGPCCFVKADTTAPEQVVQATDSSDIVGISPEYQRLTPGLPGSDTTVCAIAGDEIRVVGIGNDCLLQLGGTVTQGDLLYSDLNGHGLTAAAGSGKIAGARALQSGTIGIKIRVVSIGARIA